jgi:Fe-S cluster assembly iron-binding protein IscA
MVPVTFKIPITVSNGGIEYYFEKTRFTQKIKTFDPDLRIDRLNIIVYDRFGNILNNNGLDWSFTLEMEADT